MLAVCSGAVQEVKSARIPSPLSTNPPLEDYLRIPSPLSTNPPLEDYLHPAEVVQTYQRRHTSSAESVDYEEGEDRESGSLERNHFLGGMIIFPTSFSRF